MSFTVLFVCRANICRSAMAEALLRAKLPVGSPVRVRSAGTHPLLGHGMDAAAALAVRERGGAPAGHLAQAAEPQLLTAADLVLTATTAQRDELVHRAPHAGPRLFTIREFVRLGDHVDHAATADDAERRHRVALVHEQRPGEPATDPTADPAADDIGDPFGAPSWLMALCADRIDAATAAIAHTLGVAQFTS